VGHDPPLSHKDTPTPTTLHHNTFYKTFVPKQTNSSVAFFSSSSDKNNNNSNKEVDHALFEEQMEELRDEREALFGFTKDDREAWSNLDSTATAASSSSNNIDNLPFEDFLRQVEELRAINNDTNENQDEHISSSSSSSKSTTATKVSTTAPTMDGGAAENSSILTHLSRDGTSVSMVDVGQKQVTRRIARAQSKVIFPPEVMDAFQITSGSPDTNEMVGPKGPIFSTAKLAGIMAAKKTSDMIPLCHPLPLERVSVDIALEDNVATIECECRVTHKTGVEMEALMGASVAALTIYDMVKAVSHQVTITDTQLTTKTGGKRTIGVVLPPSPQ